MKNELEDYLDQVKGHFKIKDVGFYFSWVKSVYMPAYDLILSNNSASVCCSITELDIVSCKTSLKELAGQKIDNMIKSLQYKEDSSSWATGALVDHEPSVVKTGKPTVEPEAQSLDELYGATNWGDLLEKDAKAKSKKKPTAAELEFKYKHQLTEGAYLDAFNAAAEKNLKEMSKSLFAESPLLAFLKAK